MNMSLEQFKEAMANDASKRADAQELTIKELHAKIEDQAVWIKQLEHRCYVLTHGSLCVLCNPDRRHNCDFARLD